MVFGMKESVQNVVVACRGFPVLFVDVKLRGSFCQEEEVILNVYANRLARCKIINVLCVLTIRCRDLCICKTVCNPFSSVSIGFIKASVVLRKTGI